MAGIPLDAAQVISAVGRVLVVETSTLNSEKRQRLLIVQSAAEVVLGLKGGETVVLDLAEWRLIEASYKAVDNAG